MTGERWMQSRVLMLGGTGRTGGRVVTELLGRDIPVRAIVRSAARLPAGSPANPLLEVVSAELVGMPVDVMQRHLADCTAVVSCLGHTISARGVLGPPRDLVERAVRTVATAVRAAEPPHPVRLILMSSVSVNRPNHADARRGQVERAALGLLRGVVPPARDNQRAADFLVHEVGPSDPLLGWVVVRPDTLREGDFRQYRVTPELVASLVRPENTRMAQIAHFMADLVGDDEVWRRWRGQMPVIVDAGEST